MIGYDRLGTNGRLGNQLFQFAALRGIAAHHGYEWCIPPDNHKTFANYGIHSAFKLKSISQKNIGFINQNVSPHAMITFDGLKILNPGIRNLTEKFYHFDQDLFDNFEDNSNLDGYLQSEKYFKNVENELREDLQFKDDILNPCKDFISQFEKIIFLHIRRGDSIGKEDYHPIQPIEYYIEALNHFDDDTFVFVSSDDVEWCSKQDIFKNERFLMNLNNDKYSDGFPVPYIDLCLMSLCSGAIIANSTLSWWGAWLQQDQNKKIIAPKNWFGPKLSHQILDDLFPDNWVII